MLQTTLMATPVGFQEIILIKDLIKQFFNRSASIPGLVLVFKQLLYMASGVVFKRDLSLFLLLKEKYFY